MSDSQPKVAIFKKGKSRPANNRKRSPSPSSSAAVKPIAGPSTVVLPSKKQAGNLLSAGTKRTTSQRDALDEEERDGPDVKWTASGSHQNAALEILAGDEAEEMLAKRTKKTHDGDDDDDAPMDGLYHGQASYKSHLKKNTEIPKAMRVGPQRSNNSTIRTVTIVDYQPDVCKDYKETGYCGFGDTCKFLHDRGTYLAGWQLDKLAEEAKRQPGDKNDSDSDSDEDIPFACLICRKPFTDPVVTRCGHYYCSACAIKRFAKTPKCLACGTPTGGLFNRAEKVIAKMKEKEKERQEKENEDVDEGAASGVQVEGLEEGAASGDEESQSEDE